MASTSLRSIVQFNSIQLWPGIALLKVPSGPVQNRLETIRFGYSFARFLNGPVWLQGTVHANMN